MAKKSLIEREKKRERLIKRYAEKRHNLKSIIQDMSKSEAEREKARIELQNIPANANPTRHRNRCAITGRPRGTFRQFGLCRIKIREYAMSGLIPGVVKASW